MTEVLVSCQGQKQSQKGNARRLFSIVPQKDVWLAAREGSLAEFDIALAQLKKNAGNINSKNAFGLTPLHIATWRNNIPIVRRLLAAGADPDAKDGESGWSSLHRALHFGHIAVASILLQSGASTTLEDSKSRTPIDLLSGPVCQVTGNGQDSVATDLLSWGSGVNYQLGTGNAHIQKLPCKVDSFHGSFVKFVSAAKFHSAAVSERGEVFTWGFGRGGRLGHPEFDIHSGQAAVITPRQVTSGLGSRRVKAIAAAKHHTVIATEGGEVFTWGSNREGQLGYTSVDTQPTPRRVGSIKPKIVAVAAVNKHTAVVSESGEVFTWGCNREGQLGYGTSNSASNYTPRVVEYLKGKVFTKVAASKYHTIVLGADGEVFTWGHRLVTPRRVVIARNIKKNGGTILKFHRKERLHVVAIAAGMAHSTALADDGTLFYWTSSDVDLKCQQIYSLGGGSVLSVSAGKFWTAAATTTGDIYIIDGKKDKDKDKLPVATRVHGVKRATSVSVGETHLLIVSSLYHPAYPPSIPPTLKLHAKDELEESDEDFTDKELNQNDDGDEDAIRREIPSLKSLCEKVAAEHLVEPRNSVQLLEVADSLGADGLRKHCEDIAIRNLDYIFAVASHTIASALPDVLASLEKSLDHRSSEPWSYRRLPTPTATLPAVIYSEEEDSESEELKTREKHMKIMNSEEGEGDQRADSFLNPRDDPSNGVAKQVRALRKKLQQIEMLEEMQSNGHPLDDQQIAKLNTRMSLESTLAELGLPVSSSSSSSSSVSPDSKGSKKTEATRKERRKSKNQKDFLSIEVSENSNPKDGDGMSETSLSSPESPNSPLSVHKKSNSESSKGKNSPPKPSKKKNKKGGLSMFLNGALDEPPAPKPDTPPPPGPKSEGPAWGGAKILKGNASLRDILDEQSKVKGSKPSKRNDHANNAKNDGKIPLSSFLPSNPIPVVPARASPAPDAETTPPWASSSTPPNPLLPSLRDIQIQQVKQYLNLSQTPMTRTAGFSIAAGQGMPADNRWFKPDIDTPSCLRSIQIEEKAMKDLKHFYGNAKVVRHQS